MGGAQRLDTRLESIRAVLERLTTCIDGFDLVGIEATVSETGRFLESRLQTMEQKLNICCRHIAKMSIVPKADVVPPGWTPTGRGACTQWT